jgi:hypothetical protein
LAVVRTVGRIECPVPVVESNLALYTPGENSPEVLGIRRDGVAFAVTRWNLFMGFLNGDEHW